MPRRNDIADILVIIVIVYVAFVITQNFCEMSPEYCIHGWGIFLALVAGVAFYFKHKLFG